MPTTSKVSTNHSKNSPLVICAQKCVRHCHNTRNSYRYSNKLDKYIIIATTHFFSLAYTVQLSKKKKK